MISSADVKLWHREAKANAVECRGAFWGYKPCQRAWDRICPFGRKPPQKPSDPHCEDVTVEMWDEVLKKEAEHGRD